MGPRRGLPEGEGPLSGARGGRGAGRQRASRGGPARSTRTGGRAGAKGGGPQRAGSGSRAGGEGRRRAPSAPADLAAPPETLFLATIPGATPSTWVDRFTTRQRVVQLVNHDEASQLAHLAHDDAGMPRHPLPQLGYVRRRRDVEAEEMLRAAGVDPRRVHLVGVYAELPVVCVGRDHLLAAWDAEADGPVPLAELDSHEELDPARFAAAPVEDPLDSAELPGAGERMALEIAASGAGHVVLPMSVARMFGRKDVVVLPLASALDDTVGMSRADREAAATRAEVEADAGDAGTAAAGPGEAEDDDAARHPGWDVALAWLKEADSELVQSFVGVARGRRGNSSR
ncbi:hypothetical protein [Micrococcus endophyticus]|uniref:LysR substrate-binding domain-containing protein n=1 Tax=Micrococcus endophyticus TaxID=455343 RepID=A0A7W9JJZ7_9MICC|nr:hypothetical protein [Micrococcus endophyticus]